MLGLDYLWVDLLCIIQDSDVDWQKEPSLMSSLSGGSEILIAAYSARDGSQACFLKPPYFSGGLHARVADGGLKRMQDFRNSKSYAFSTPDTHLGTRAWEIQDKILPPRTIHFGDRGAFWECRSTIASEYLPDGFPNMLVNTLVYSRGEFILTWVHNVELYSAANLTFGKDELPAKGSKT